MPIKLIVPRMGEAVIEATISLWLKKEGDKVEEGEPLLEVNTDKVDSEISSPSSGILLRIIGHPGDVIPVDGLLGWIGEPGEEIPEDDSSPVAVEKIHQIKSNKIIQTYGLRATPVAINVAAENNIPLNRVSGTGAGGRIHKRDVLNYQPDSDEVVIDQDEDYGYFISPVVARLVQQHDLELSKIRGTGLNGRITKRDVLAYIEKQPSKQEAEIDPENLIKLSPVRKTIAERMVASKHTSPHVASFMEVDMTAVIKHRTENKAAFAEKNLRLTFTAYLAFAVAKALKTNPMANASWHAQGIILHPQINVGMATSLGEQGLIVPVIKDAADMALDEIAFAVTDLAERARNKKLKPEEVQGGTFSITNHGTSGSLFAMPIINQPQTGILSVGAIQKRAVVVDDEIVIRPMMYIGLTFDHRILDGEAADTFLTNVKDTLENWN